MVIALFDFLNEIWSISDSGDLNWFYGPLEETHIK